MYVRQSNSRRVAACSWPCSSSGSGGTTCRSDCTPTPRLAPRGTAGSSDRCACRRDAPRRGDSSSFPCAVEWGRFRHVDPRRGSTMTQDDGQPGYEPEGAGGLRFPEALRHLAVGRAGDRGSRRGPPPVDVLASVSADADGVRHQDDEGHSWSLPRCGRQPIVPEPSGVATAAPSQTSFPTSGELKDSAVRTLESAGYAVSTSKVVHVVQGIGHRRRPDACWWRAAGLWWHRGDRAVGEHADGGNVKMPSVVGLSQA